MESLAEAAFKNEHDVEEVVVETLSRAGQIENVTEDILCKVNTKVDEKLEDFLKGTVQDAFRAVFEAFSSHVGNPSANSD